tara:strand:+ start:838 stop:1050 length:213 start_codon:yes stop_codon:yes gene_type:complete
MKQLAMKAMLFTTLHVDDCFLTFPSSSVDLEQPTALGIVPSTEEAQQPSKISTPGLFKTPLLLFDIFIYI